MPPRSSIGIGRTAYLALRSAYRRRWKVALTAVRPDGRVAYPDPSAKDPSGSREPYRHAIREALRWGEPTVDFCPPGRLIWAVPLMHNSQLLGGLIASIPEKRVFPDESGTAAIDLRAACGELRTLTEQANLTNAALLASRRDEYARERQRAEAIHEFKLIPYLDVREMYLRHEPALIAAIRKDDRAEARGMLNTLLTAIYYRSRDRLDLVKSFLMELVVTMCRTAVESGGHPEGVFGSNFASISELSQIESQEALAFWVHDMLERIMDAIRTHRGNPPVQVVSTALQYMSEHFGENISRDDTAAASHVSPSHLSRMIKRHLGRTYTDLLNQMRVDKAAELLVRTDRPLTAIAFDTGFRDQSYFTKVFRRYTHLTPRGYRLRHRPGGDLKDSRDAPPVTSS